jgi:hypothetical protein
MKTGVFMSSPIWMPVLTVAPPLIGLAKYQLMANQQMFAPA